jgi:glycosyltransferase involved in cell wall biosynthesis
MLLPAVPWPADAGAKIRNAGLLQTLREQHEVDVLAFGASGEQRPGVEVIPFPARRSVGRRVVDLGRSHLPDMAQRLWSPAYAEALACRLERTRYDAVQAEGIEMARYLRLVAPERRVYDAHNAEFLLQQRLASRTSGAGALYSRLQWRRLERFEGGVVRHSRLTLAVSAHDANQLLALAGGAANVRVVPNAIDIARYPFRPPSETTTGNLLFLGKLDFRPNAEALAWFIDEVLPQTDASRLFAVGGAPPKWLVRSGQHDPRIAVTGYVSDERPYLARCAALVLPVSTGGGSRLKALVAMAVGLPIISTRLGMEGLEAEAGTHFLQVETASDWIEGVRRILSDTQLRRRLACEARALVEQRYDWSAMRSVVQNAYAWL